MPISISALVRFCTAGLLALLAACASGPDYDKMVASLGDIPAGQGRIYFFRPASTGAGVQPAVKLNGETVGVAAPQGFFYIDRPAGEYEVVTSQSDESVSVVLQAGDTVYVRLSSSLGLFAEDVYPEVVDDSAAMRQLRGTKYSGATAQK